MTAFWDEQAATFDDEPDHGLRDAEVRTAWADLLLPLLPPGPAEVVDLGCGTGSLAVLLAEAGHHVRGVDLAARMVEAAVAKAAAAGVAPSSCRVMPRIRRMRRERPTSCWRGTCSGRCPTRAALGRWVPLLRPGGRCS
nr:class I SAM-dependent methyltransferase [Lentzea guizhouensis]